METCMHGWVQTFFIFYFLLALFERNVIFSPFFSGLLSTTGKPFKCVGIFRCGCLTCFFVFFFRLLLRSPTTVITASNHRAHPKPRRAPFSLVSGVSAKVVRRAKLPQLIWNSCVLVLFRLVLYVARVIRNLPVLYKLNAADRESRKRENLENGDRYKNL